MVLKNVYHELSKWGPFWLPGGVLGKMGSTIDLGPDTVVLKGSVTWPVSEESKI